MPHDEPPGEANEYTVFLVVPECMRAKDDELGTYAAHVEAPNVHAAIDKAYNVAASTYHCERAVALTFEPLIVLQGHHDPLLF